MVSRTFGLLALVAGVAFGCGAADFKTTDSFQTASYWVQAFNWTDLDGHPVELPPTNINDTAYLTGSTPTVSGLQHLRSIPFANSAHIATGGGDCKRVEFGRVYGDYRMLLQLGTQTGYGCPSMTVSVADPDDFHGWWGSYSGRGNIELRAEPGHSPKLSHYDINGYMLLTVPDAGTSASVESLYRSGALRKNGDGELVVCQGAGCGSRIYCATGSVTLVGLSDAVYEGEIPKAWLHLDATRRDTMVTFEKDGRECLSRWNDCDGGLIYATTNFPAERLGQPSTIPYVYPPFISASTSPSGKALVDFGMTDLDVTSGLPSNCVMTTSEKLSTAKEFFFAARSSSTHTSRNYRALIGAVGTSQYLGYGHTHVFNTYNANQTLVASRHVTFNGMQVHPLGLGAENSRFSTRYGDMPRDFSVISFGSEAELKFDLIGSDGGYIERTGGWQLGELLVYDRTLTPEERIKINRYLMEKWQKDSRPDEAGEVVLNDNTSISVPAGHTARIKSLSTMGTKIVKKGEGRLIVDGIAPAGTKLDIQGGSIVVKTPEVALQPAANPYFWIDATDEQSLVMSPDNVAGGNQYITRWNDCNGGSVYAELPLEENPTVGSSTQKNIYFTDDRFKGNMPWVVKGASPTKLDMVNFGKLSNKTQSFMQLQPHNVANAYCGFIVVKALEAGLTKQYFGSASTDLLQLNWHRLGNESYTHKDILAAAWTVDGRAMDPLADADAVIVTTNCLVVAFANESSKVRADLLSKYTYNQEGSGGQMIGEMLLYDRPLSAEERRNTEAYLMKKWLGKDHPESAAGARVTYKYPSDKPVVVDTGANGAVSVEGGNREFIKRGNGATMFDDLAVVSNFVSFAAENGSLAVTLDIPDDAFYRYDASDVDSFTSTYLTDDGNGGQVTNILKWADQVSGRIAQSAHINGFSEKYAGYSGGTCTNPTLTAVTMPDGVARPTVDFGEYNNVAWIWKDTTSPVPLGTFNSSSGFSLYDYGNTTTYGFKEVHAVYADRPKDDGSGTETRAMVFTALSANPLTLKTEDNLWRGSAGALFSETGGKSVCEGVIHLDGEAVPASTKPSAGFHLVSIQPTNKVNVSAIALDRNCNAGGCYISEYVAYKEPHSPEVFAYVEAKLMRKWFGTAAERPLWLTSLATLTAAAGSTLTLTTEAKVSVNELAGAGTIVAPELVGVSSLALVHPAGTLTASGAVSLADEGMVSFSGDLAGIDAGAYTVFSAGTLTNGEAVENWTLDAELPGNRRASLSAVGNAVVLTVKKPGMILLVR